MNGKLRGLAFLVLLSSVAWLAWRVAVSDDDAAAPDRAAPPSASLAPVRPELDADADAVADADATPPAETQRASTAPSSEPAPESEAMELSGAVHDKASGEPLFDFELGAWVKTRQGGARLPGTRTDEQGRFSFGPRSLASEAQEIVVNSTDHPSIRRRNVPDQHRVKRATPQSPFELPLRIDFDVGPTVAFELEFPDEKPPSDFTVGLYGSRPPPNSWARPELEAELRAALDFGPHPGRPWVRFGEPTQQLDRAWIELRSKDKRWRGGAWLTQLVGVVEKPLVVKLETTTRLTGRFTWPAGVEEEHVQGLRLAELRAGEPSGLPMHGSAGRDGEFKFNYLSPGRYRLWTNDAHWKPFELDFDVFAGENDLGAHALTPRRVVGPLRVVIRSKSGRFDGACHVSLSDKPLSHDAPFDHSIDFEPVVEGDESSERVAEWEFEDVTEGDWFLYVHCHNGFEFPESVTVVRAELARVEIVLDDPSMDVRVEIVEAESGQPCTEAEFAWECGNERETESGASVKLTHLPDAPESFSWIASAPGRQLALGTGLDFERTVRADGGVELARRVALAPGFSRRVCVRKRGDGAPLEGAEILCDGELAGVSGADGAFVLRRETKPERIAIRKPGWIHVSTRYLDARTGRYSSEAELYMHMEPEHP
jgi:hypothetical protein